MEESFVERDYRLWKGVELCTLASVLPVSTGLDLDSTKQGSVLELVLNTFMGATL